MMLRTKSRASAAMALLSKRPRPSASSAAPLTGEPMPCCAGPDIGSYRYSVSALIGCPVRTSCVNVRP